MVISFLQIQNLTEFEFANQSFTLQPNSVKVTVEIFSWPFQTIKNQLQLAISINVQDPQQYTCHSQNTSTDDSGKYSYGVIN